MADKRISDLTAVLTASVTNASMIPIVVATSSAVTNKIDLQNLKAFILSGIPSGSGTAQYIASWGSSNVIQASWVYVESSFVSFGNTSRGNLNQKVLIYSSTADNHIAAVGTSPSYRLYESTSNTSNMGVFGLASSSALYLNTSNAGDLVIATTNQILLGTGGTERLKISSDGTCYIAGTLHGAAGIRANGTVTSTVVQRLTTTERDALTSFWKTAGAIIYNTTLSVFQGYTGSAWLTF